jgi:hypothetical protein
MCNKYKQFYLGIGPRKDAETIQIKTTIHSSLRMRLFGRSSPRLRLSRTPVSLAASLPYVALDGTKLGLVRSTSKMTLGSVATRASARGQTPRSARLSLDARIKGRKRFRYPTRSISCIQPLAHLAVSSVVGGTEEGAQSTTWIRYRLVFLRNPANSKGKAEARFVHQFKSIRYNASIFGRLSAKAKRPAHWNHCHHGHGTNQDVITKCFLQSQHQRYEPIISDIATINRKACEVW